APCPPPWRSFGVANPRRHAVVGVGGLEVPSTEKAHDHPRTGGGVGLAPLHSVEDRLAGVFGGPYGGVAGGSGLPAHDHGLVGLDEGMRRATGARVGRRYLAEVNNIPSGRNSRM